MDPDLQSSLNYKLAGWCALYAGAMIFIGLRIFGRLYIFGSLTVDDWLMVAAAIAYTGAIITEIFIFLAFRAFDIVSYIKVSLSHFWIC